jgi:anti-sigma regulatory factor (Ser/Thr protein kinase)
MSSDAARNTAADAGPDVFGGAGELGRHLARVDWAATSLGEPSTWSQSLVSAVRLVLASKFSMWMAWGPDLTFFCNETYRRDTLGAKYPWALGRPTPEVWAEVWDDVRDRVESVVNTGVATWDESLLLFLERHGYTEETYHTFSYSPLFDDDGRVGGLLCVVTEDTERVIGARRLRTLRDLSSAMAPVTSESQMLEAARAPLAANAHSLPFTLTYLFDEQGETARLALSTGISPGHPAAPPMIEVVDAGAPWALGDAVDGRPTLIDDLPARFSDLPTGAWDVPPLQALAVPLEQPGEHRPYGVMIVGLNRFRPADQTYRGYIDLIVGQLAGSITRARTLDAERRRNQELTAREHTIAEQLQRSLLPRHAFHPSQLDVATYYRAGVEGTQVGGDWYDVIELGRGRTALVLGDVMGRGVHAAAVMGQLRATVRAYARLDLPPSEVLHLLDAAVQELSSGTIVTCVYAAYDPEEQTLSYANAGHLPPLLTMPGQAPRRLTVGGPPLGSGLNEVGGDTVDLPAGSLLALYTDGLVEHRGSDIDVGIDKLAALLGDSTIQIDGLPERLVSDLLPEGPDDDVAVLIVRPRSALAGVRAATREIVATGDAVRQARAFTAETLRAWGVPEPVVQDAGLVVSELVTNAVAHGEPPIELRLRLDVDAVGIDVHDSDRSTPRRQHVSPAEDHGRGLAIVAALTQQWGTRLTPSGKSVWCTLTTAGR